MGGDIDLTYAAADRPAGITFPNGVGTAASYDIASGRLAYLAHTRGGTDSVTSGT